MRNIGKIRKIIKRLCNKCKAKAVTAVQYKDYSDHENAWCEVCKPKALGLAELLSPKTVKKIEDQIKNEK